MHGGLSVDTLLIDAADWGQHDALIRSQEWTVVNAPRPLAGRVVWQGPFRRGVFYAAGPKAEFLDTWQAADATEIQLASNAQVLELLRERIRSDGYDPDEVLGDPGAFGFGTVKDVAAQYHLPWPDQAASGA
jgi:hypothetical protein